MLHHSPRHLKREQNGFQNAVSSLDRISHVVVVVVAVVIVVVNVILLSLPLLLIES